MSHDIFFSDGTYSYHIDDEEGFLVILTDERDEKGNFKELFTVGPNEMEAFIEWLTSESRRKAALRKDG